MELDAIGKAIQQYHLVPLVSHMNLGLEVTMQRVDAQGALSTQPAPQVFEQAAKYSQLHTGVVPTQLKFSTPAMATLSDLMAYLKGLNTTARRTLAADDYLWPLASVPVVPTAMKEPGTKLLTTGTHVNLSFNEQLLTRLYTEQFHQSYSSYIDFRNAVYLKVAQGFVRMNWLIQYLFGATPTLTMSAKKVKRQRSSVQGAGRKQVVTGDYTSVAAYVHQIQTAVQQRKLVSSREFDGVVRLRGQGELANLVDQGVYYLEFRGLDLDPTKATGVDQNAVAFIRLLASYFVMMPALPAAMVPKVNAQAAVLTAQVTGENPTTASTQAQPALQVLTALGDFVAKQGLPASDRVLLTHLQTRVQDPKQTLSAQVAQQADALKWANQQAQTYQTDALAETFTLPGFQALELSSQLLTEQALRQGVQAKIIDAPTGILRLTKAQEPAQLVVRGSGTDLNPQAMTTVLAHKVAAKQIMAEHGVLVPASKTYRAANQLIADYDRYATGGIVLKATDRNQVVAAFRIMPQRQLFEQVVRQLFEQTTSVMAEELIVASSYRFLVIGGKVQAIIERIPANLVGDGRSTVQVLLDKKNARPLRGAAATHPQSVLTLGTVERYRLESYHLTLDSVVSRGTQILLREDATFGSGPDSLDVTDEMDASYCQAVEKLAADLDLTVAGFDVMIPNLYAALTPDHPEMAVYLGVHATPALYPHEFPTFGDAQPVATKLLAQLFKTV